MCARVRTGGPARARPRPPPLARWRPRETYAFDWRSKGRPSICSRIDALQTNPSPSHPPPAILSLPAQSEPVAGRLRPRAMAARGHLSHPSSPPSLPPASPLSVRPVVRSSDRLSDRQHHRHRQPGRSPCQPNPARLAPWRPVAAHLSTSPCHRAGSPARVRLGGFPCTLNRQRTALTYTAPANRPG